MWLLECLKAPVLEHPSRLKVLTRTKHFWTLQGSSFNLISINGRQIELENVPVN